MIFAAYLFKPKRVISGNYKIHGYRSFFVYHMVWLINALDLPEI